MHRSIADEFREVLKVAVNNILEGPNAELVIIKACAIAKNKDMVRDAISKGGRILLGDLDTQVASATRMRTIVVEMDIYHAESFGPTTSLFVVDSDEEAISLANDTEYGLSAAAYTENLARGLQQIDSG